MGFTKQLTTRGSLIVLISQRSTCSDAPTGFWPCSNRSAGVLFPTSDQPRVLFKTMSWIITSLQETSNVREWYGKETWHCKTSAIHTQLILHTCDFAHMYIYITLRMDVSSRYKYSAISKGIASKGFYHRWNSRTPGRLGQTYCKDLTANGQQG